jgi:hypothetical protein
MNAAKSKKSQKKRGSKSQKETAPNKIQRRSIKLPKTSNDRLNSNFSSLTFRNSLKENLPAVLRISPFKEVSQIFAILFCIKMSAVLS